MKKLMIAGQVILLMLLMVEACAAQNIKKKGKIKIVDVRQTKLPDDDLKQHKYHDIAVYRTISESERKKYDDYEVRFYSNFDDTLFCYEAGLGHEGDYTRVKYKWENDTLADITLYNKGRKGKKSYKVFGTGHNGIKRSGVITEY